MGVTMNLSSLFGVFFGLTIFSIAIAMSTDNFVFFLNLHALVIVIGGTCAAAFLCFPAKKLFTLLRVAYRRFLGKNRRNYTELINEIVALAKAYEQGFGRFTETIKRTQDTFLRDAATALEWAPADIEESQLREMLENKLETFHKRYMKEANIFRTLAKFPPAFGLLGTTLGMIALMQSLGPGSQATIGTSMAVALVATVYGIAAANLVLIPIAENLTEQTEEDHICRRIVVEGVMMIMQRLPVQFIEENAKSFLLPSEMSESAAAAKLAS